MYHYTYLTEEEIEAPRGGLAFREGNVGGRAQKFRAWIVWPRGLVPDAARPFLSFMGPRNPSPTSRSPSLEEPSVAHAVGTLHAAPAYNFLYLYLSFACHQAVYHHAATNSLYVLNIYASLCVCVCLPGYIYAVPPRINLAK